MRILVVQESDWIKRGPHQNHHLMERMNERGHEIHVIDFEITWRESPDLGLYLDGKTFVDFRKATSNGHVTVVRPAMVRLPVLDYYSIFQFQRRVIKRQFAEFKPDIVIGFGILNSWIAIRQAMMRSCPFVYYVIDELHTLVREPYLQGVARLVESWNMRNSDLVISINQKLCDYALEMGARPERTRTIGAGVDINSYAMASRDENLRHQLGISDSDIVLFFMGWLYNFSGLKEVAEALASRDKRLERVKLLVVGQGDLWDTLTEIRDKNNLNGRLILIPWRPYREIPHYLSVADICILPALPHKTMMTIVPIKLYEYLAAGKPVIATPLPGIVREFGDHSGIHYISNPREVPAKAFELVHLGLLADSAERARNRVKGCSWENVTDEFERTLEGLL